MGKIRVGGKMEEQWERDLYAFVGWSLIPDDEMENKYCSTTYLPMYQMVQKAVYRCP